MHSLLDSCEIRKDKIIEQRLKFAIQNNTAILVYKIKIKNEVWKHLKLILILFMNLNESIYVQVLKIVIQKVNVSSVEKSHQQIRKMLKET